MSKRSSLSFGLHARVLLLAAAVVAFGTAPASAESALVFVPVQAGQIRVDGALGEWRGARFACAGEGTQGPFCYALGFDDSALYLAARVYDEDFVRSSRPSAREDAVVLSLAIPRARGGARTQEVWLYAGIVGKQAASAALSVQGGAQRATSDVSVVEGPLEDEPGYVIEARIPLTAIEGASDLPVGRGALRLHDVDRKGGASDVQTSRASGLRLPPLLFDGGPNDALAAFFRDKGMSVSEPRFELFGDVGGDARLERVLIAGTFAVCSGADTHGGYRYVDLPVLRAPDVLDAELVDLTGDGRAELVTRLRQENELGERTLLQVRSLDAPPRMLLAIETGKKSAAGEVTSDVRIASGRGREPATIEARIGQAKGLDASGYKEAAARDAEPILLPWGPVAQRSYRWDGTRFAVVAQQENPNAQQASPTPVASRAAAPASTAEPGIVHSEPPGTDELVEAFRSARGIDASESARFVTHANLAEDPRLESLMAFGRELLVVGKGFREGFGYFYFGLPVREGSDVLRIFTGDVTGDGRREIFVRVRQRIGDVQREILLGYTFAGDALAPILATEVRRAQARSSIGNIVRLVKARGRWELRIEPGRATGWSRDSYPFVAESSDGIGPLLLPWLHGEARYRFDGQQLVAAVAAKD